MFETVGAAIFVLVVVFALYYCSMYLMYLLWNNKYARRARIEALISTRKFIERLEYYEKIMKKTGYDHYREYEYYDIKDFDICCTCKHFCDNQLETRFECHKAKQDENCYENRFEN